MTRLADIDSSIAKLTHKHSHWLKLYNVNITSAKPLIPNTGPLPGTQLLRPRSHSSNASVMFVSAPSNSNNSPSPSANHALGFGYTGSTECDGARHCSHWPQPKRYFDNAFAFALDINPDGGCRTARVWGDGTCIQASGLIDINCLVRTEYCIIHLHVAQSTVERQQEQQKQQKVQPQHCVFVQFIL